MYYVYILQSGVDGSYYRGHTNDLANRIIRHNNQEETYTKKLAPWDLVWCCTKSSKSEAYELELKLKNLSRKKLEAFILKYMDESILKRFRP